MKNQSGLKVALLLAVVSATPAEAKLISATLPAPDEALHIALHRPTGCLAQLVFRNDSFVKAQITDPACLPKGVKSRDIPSTLYDFVVTPPDRSDDLRYPSHLFRRR